jgi:hypothetical protein
VTASTELTLAFGSRAGTWVALALCGGIFGVAVGGLVVAVPRSSSM